VEHRALVVVAGPEGETLARTVEAMGREVIRVAVHPGRVLEPDHLERFLEGPEVDTVALVHADRGTGARLPLAELARVVRRRRDLLLFVDATATLGAEPVETDAWGLDLVVAPGEGPLALPPGLAMASVSPRLRMRARRLKGRGLELDLMAHWAAAESNRTVLPIPLGSAMSLDLQLDRALAGDGMTGRWARQRRSRTIVDGWAAPREDLRVVASEPWRAESLTCLRLAGEAPAERIVAALATEGYTIARGLGEDAGHVLRIGHMGEVGAEALEGLLGVVGGVLSIE
jgi:aspartate aminotransferase-like enzyme